jgi:diacylglycerol kinase (ATP)
VKVLVMFNPVSGSGRAAAAADDLIGHLRAAKHEVTGIASRLDSPRIWLEPAVQDRELLVAVGGDGAVRIAGTAAARTGTAIYHFPQGTENLFAREFGMDRNPQTLLRAIENPQYQTIDVGEANGRTFLLMVSIGFDANVVHDLASRRGDSISHWTYVLPILNQLRTWKPPRLTIEVDGRRVNHDQAGFVVVGNCKQYGWRLNPTARACMNDGLLDVAFFPCRSRLDLIRWAFRCRRQTHLDHPELVYCTGQRVMIRSDSPQHYQLDGDSPGVVHEMAVSGQASHQGPEPLHLAISLKRNAVRVLAPPT